MHTLKILLLMILCFSISFAFSFASIQPDDILYEYNCSFIDPVVTVDTSYSGSTIRNISRIILNINDLPDTEIINDSSYSLRIASFTNTYNSIAWSKNIYYNDSYIVENPISTNYLGILFDQAGSYDLSGLKIIQGDITYTFGGDNSFLGWQTNNIEVKAGYVLVVDRFYNGSIISDLPDHIQINSIVSVPKPLFKSWNNGASFGYLNNLSDLSASDDLASNNLIWARPSNGGNYAGTQADFNTSSSRYWYFVNPLYYISGNKQYVNNSAIVKFENVSSAAPEGFLGNYYLIPLSASTSPNSPTGFDNTVNTSKEIRIWYGTEDSEGNINNQGWYSYSDLEALISQSSVDTDSIGFLSDVPVGGNNSGDIYSSISDTQSSAELTLFQKIESLLSSGLNSIDRLFQSAQGFFQYLSNLWSWLPEDIMLIISSVIIIFLIVGCIKLFL